MNEYMIQIAHPNVGFFCFLRIPIVYKRIFNAIYKLYKDDKITNEILGNDRHECPFYDALDSWWHQNINVTKHVSVFKNEIVSNSKFQTKFDRSFKDDGIKEPLDKPFTPNEVQNKTKGKRPMLMSIFQPWLKIIQ
jgi:hypothetical protein